MNESHISRRYAKAVFSYARDLGEEKALYERMLILTQNCNEMPELMQTLVSPVIRAEDKKTLLFAAAGAEIADATRDAGSRGDAENGGAAASSIKSYEAFTRVVIGNQREELVRNIAMAYIKIYREVHNISIIQLTSARALTEGIRERIAKSVTDRTGGTAEIDIRIDASIQGGFILQVDDRRLDASVKGQLDRIRRQLAGNGKRLV